MRARSIPRPSLGEILGVFLVLAVAVLGGQRLFGDSDPALHVATGNWILEHHHVPHVDPFSGTWSGKEWFAHEWLADLLWALVHRAAGWSGLAALSACLIAIAHFCLYRFLVRAGFPALVAFVCVSAAAATAASHWLARPHLLTVLLLVIWTGVLEDVARGRSRPRRLALLPFLMLFWVNLHGGFLVALAVLGCFVAGALLPTKSRRNLGPLLLVTLASLAASLVNPYGWRLPAHLVGYFGAFRAQLAANQEFAPASAGDRAGVALFGFLAACVGSLLLRAWVLRRRAGAFRLDDPRASAGAALAFLATSVLALSSIRHAEIAAIPGAWMLATGLSSLFVLLSEADRQEWERLRIREAGGPGWIFVLVLAALVPCALAGIPRNAGYDSARFPVQAVRSLERAGVVPEGPVFSTAIWGGYLILTWPQGRVYVDGRTDMYGDAFMAGWAEIYSALPGWQGRLESAGVRWAVLPADAPLVPALDVDPTWTRFSSDPVAVVFRRRAG